MIDPQILAREGPSCNTCLTSAFEEMMRLDRRHGKE